MRIYLLIAEDPFYTKDLLKNIINSYPNQIVGAAFPKGFLNLKRVLKTFFIYGPFKFFKMGISVLYNSILGGKVKLYLKSKGIYVEEIKDVNDPKFLSYLRKLGIDLIISNNCPQLLKKQILGLPKNGCINLHLGKLPHYRGIFPIFHAIANGENNYGITVHYMNEKFDDGPIIAQEVISFEKNYDLLFHYNKAFKKGSILLINAIKDIENNMVIKLPNQKIRNSYFSYPTFRQIINYHLR